jgi:hypothetical protein
VPSCLEACNRRFQGAAADGVSWADLHTFYNMPDTLRGGVLKQAGEVFAAKLRAAYLHLEEAWREDALRGQFCGLPLGAVEALAALDELQVVSENTVAAALATWLAHGLPGRRAAGKQLLGLVRLQHLSQCYVREVLLHLPGLGEHLTVEQAAGGGAVCNGASRQQAAHQGTGCAEASPGPACQQPPQLRVAHQHRFAGGAGAAGAAA